MWVVKYWVRMSHAVVESLCLEVFMSGHHPVLSDQTGFGQVFGSR